MALLAMAGIAFAVSAANLLPSKKTVTGLACSEVRELASDYTAGRLDPDVMAQVKSHLARCRRCGRSMEAFAAGSQSPNAVGSGGPGCNDECERERTSWTTR